MRIMLIFLYFIKIKKWKSSFFVYLYRGGDKMLVAMTKNETFIYANEVSQNGLDKERYYCPKCHQSVILKKSTKGKIFFSHQTKCESDVPRVKPLESNQHLRGKEILISELSQIDGSYVNTELFFPDLNQYADVYIEELESKSKRVIYEFQRSVIPAHELYMRHYNYQRKVDEVHWLLDYQSTKSKKLNQRWLQTMLSYSQALGFHLKSLDLKTTTIVVKFNLPLIYQSEWIQYEEVRLSIKDFHLDLINNTSSQSQNITTQEKTSKAKQSSYRIRSIMNNESYREDIYLLYQEGVILNNLPTWIFNENWQILISKTPTWLVICWSIALLKQMAVNVKLDEFSNKLKQCDRIKIAQLPFISVATEKAFALVILQLLILKKVLLKTQEGEIILSDEFVKMV